MTTGQRAWNHMQVELKPEDALLLPLVGAGDMTRDEARAQVQSLLDRATQVRPEFEYLATLWRNDEADDDAVGAGPFIWTIYEYDVAEGPRKAAHEWLSDFAAPMRADGIDVQISRLPDRPGQQ